MPPTTLLPIGAMIYFRGCENNPEPDFGWVTEHRTAEVFCAAREAHVTEPHYLVYWADGNSYWSTHLELEGKDFIILENTNDNNQRRSR